MARLPIILTARDLPISELRAMRLDGELIAVDDAFAPIDQPPSALQRATSIAHFCQQRLIAEQRTAAWIWGATLGPPRRLEFCASIGARARGGHPARLQVREVVIAPDEIALLGASRVTTPLRTVIDLARFQEAFDRELVEALLRATGLTRDRCMTELAARPHLPGKRLALKRLATLTLGESLRDPSHVNS